MHIRVVPLAILVALAGVAVAGCGGGAATPTARSSAPPENGSPARSSASAPAAGAQRAALDRLRRIGLPVYCAGHRGHEVALTFDDGPGPYTHYALKELRHAHVRATFFLVAKSIRSYPEWPRRETRIAAIGDHTATHPYLPGLSPSEAQAQIRDGQLAAERSSGTTVSLFRPPYGARTPAIDRDAAADGMVEIVWNVDSGDSDTANPQNFAAITRNVLDGAIPGSIVLFHDNRGQTIRALRTILPELARRGLRAVTVPELLADDPPSLYQLRAGAGGCRLSGPPTGGG